MLDIVIKLYAHDEFLCKRIMNLPEKLVQDTHNTEDGLTRRLTEYHTSNNEEESVANVFEEEYEIDVIKIGADIVEEDKSLLHKNIVNMIKTSQMKDPRNYGLTQDEKDMLKKIQIEERSTKEREEKEERERRAAEETLERVKKQSEWVCIFTEFSVNWIFFDNLLYIIKGREVGEN